MLITKLFFEPSTSSIVLLVGLAGFGCFMIFNGWKKKKNAAKLKKERQKSVKETIKLFLKNEYAEKNKQIEFEKVITKTGKEYRSRDVFTVLVELKDPKEKDPIIKRAFELEGTVKQIDKNKNEVLWTISKELDYDLFIKEISEKKRKKTIKEMFSNIFKKTKKIIKSSQELKKINNKTIKGFLTKKSNNKQHLKDLQMTKKIQSKQKFKGGNEDE